MQEVEHFGLHDVEHFGLQEPHDLRVASSSGVVDLRSAVCVEVVDFEQQLELVLQEVEHFGLHDVEHLGLQEELHDLRVGALLSFTFIVLQHGLQLLVLQQEVLHVALQHDLHDEVLQHDVLLHEVLQQLVLQQPARVISLHSPRKFNAV